ncbi:MAG: hypothetical protein QXT74_04175 [Candidatus Nezhaarchaeales archaeon]
MAQSSELEELRRALSYFKTQCERLRGEVAKLRRALRAVKNSGVPLPSWISDMDIDGPGPGASGRVDQESLRRLAYRAALEAYQKLSRPVKVREVEEELVKLSIRMGIDPPSRPVVARLLRRLADRKYYGCEPPLLKVEGGYVPQAIQQERPNTLDSYLAQGGGRSPAD